MTGAAHPSGRPVWRVGLLLALGCLLALGFVALGVWQVERRAWKLDLIERVDARIHAEPVAAPPTAAFDAAEPGSLEYLRVSLNGHYLNDRETFVQAVTERGAGFWVVTPFVTDAGETVLVNRGFVPPDLREPGSRAAGQIGGETTVTGLLRLSEPKGGFLRDNDPASDRWFSRDVSAIASARGLDGVAPYFVDADAVAGNVQAPVGGLTVVQFSNNHLVYLLTWFGLAGLVLFGMGMLLRHEMKARSRLAGSAVR